jgi:hypothetical protein
MHPAYCFPGGHGSLPAVNDQRETQQCLQVFGSLQPDTYMMAKVAGSVTITSNRVPG